MNVIDIDRLSKLDRYNLAKQIERDEAIARNTRWVVSSHLVEPAEIKQNQMGSWVAQLIVPGKRPGARSEMLVSSATTIVDLKERIKEVLKDVTFVAAKPASDRYGVEAARQKMLAEKQAKAEADADAKKLAQQIASLSLEQVQQLHREILRQTVENWKASPNMWLCSNQIFGTTHENLDIFQKPMNIESFNNYYASKGLVVPSDSQFAEALEFLLLHNHLHLACHTKRTVKQPTVFRYTTSTTPTPEQQQRIDRAMDFNELQEKVRAGQNRGQRY